MKKYKEKLKSKFAVSDTYLEDKLNELPLVDWEDNEREALDIRVIDPPVVNGVDLREHPNPIQRKRYRAILDAGGVIAGVFQDDKVIELMSVGLNNKPVQSFEDFAPKIERKIFNKVFSKVNDILVNEFEPHNTTGRNSGKMRLKSMKPDDFWSLFSSEELQAINSSEDQRVIDFVVAMNKNNHIKIKNKNVQDGVLVLEELNLLSKDSIRNLKYK